METVSKLVDAGYKAIWGPGDTDSKTEVHDERRDQSKETSSIASTANIKAVEAGEWSIVPEQLQSHNIPHGEEPLSGVTGKGTSTDPYDAGNRDGMFRQFSLSLHTTWHLHNIVFGMKSSPLMAVIMDC
jgi:hypothetical protein